MCDGVTRPPPRVTGAEEATVTGYEAKALD